MGKDTTGIFVRGVVTLLILLLGGEGGVGQGGNGVMGHHDVIPNSHYHLGSLGKEYSGIVNSGQEYSYRYAVFKNDENLVVHTNVPLSASPYHPVTFSVRRQRFAQSWQLPLKSASGKVYHTTNRTVCIAEHSPDSPLFPISSTSSETSDEETVPVATIVTVTVSSQSLVPASFTLLVTNADHFLALNDIMCVNITLTAPQIFHFRFPPEDKMNSSVVKVSLYSLDDLCTTVSLQEPTCPYNDQEANVHYQGLHYTMTQRGAVTISRTKYPNGFFLVVVLHSSDKKCLRGHPMIETNGNHTRIKNFAVVVQEFFRDSDIAWSWSLLPIASACLIIFVQVLTCCMSRWCRWRLCPAAGGAGAKDPARDKEIVTVDKMCHRNNEQLQKKTRRYVYFVMPIALYYFLPALQLVFMYSVTSDKTGNLDMCYYNFECAYPLGPINDANHVYSNLGYVIMGLAALLTIWMHQRMCPGRVDKGIPPHYGFSYALAVVILVEGLLSASYHGCPNHSNFHHDTCFMYVAVTLTTLKLYQARHSGTNIGATTAFGVLGVIMIVDLGGEFWENWWYFGTFMVLHVVSFLMVATRMYFLGFRPMWSSDTFKNVWNMLRKDRECATSDKPVASRDVYHLIVVAAVFNIVIIILNAIKFQGTASTGSFDFGSYILTILGGNMAIYFLYYLAMKKIHGEEFGIPTAILLTMAMGFWIWGGINFIDIRTAWEETPAQSRTYNRPCTFFDSHDWWHLLSAAALYTTLTAIEFLDHPLAATPRDKIPVF